MLAKHGRLPWRVEVERGVGADAAAVDLLHVIVVLREGQQAQQGG